MFRTVYDARDKKIVEVPLTADEIQALEPDTEAERPGMSLSFAQLLIGLVTYGWITEVEGDNWADGVLPGAVTQLIATLPQAQRFAARVRAKRPSVVVRSDPLVNALATAQGKTQAELDDFFRTFSGV